MTGRLVGRSFALPLNLPARWPSHHQVELSQLNREVEGISMSDKNNDVLSEVVSDCVYKVFEAYDTELEEAPKEDPGHEVVAVIGYAADEVRGGMALGISKKLAEMTMPTPDTPLYDWAGELANQILGRVRNKMLAYQIDVQISTPVVLHGLGVQVAPPRSYGCEDRFLSPHADPGHCPGAP
jgi:CheY-specific phosphatase CheX